MDAALNRKKVVHPASRALATRGKRVLRKMLIALNIVGLVVLVLMVSNYRIHDDITFQPEVQTEGGLKSVDMAAALVLREVQNTSWAPNDPALMPGAWLRNMNAFQQGLVYSQARFAHELADSLGRSRGATAVDPRLDRASGLLRFPANVWRFDFQKSWAPTITSEAQYTAAARALLAYNQAYAAGQVIFDPRPDNLSATLERIETDISSQANILIEHVERLAAGERARVSANEVFFATKGRLYGYTMVLKALGEDFEDVIDGSGARLMWDRMIESLETAATIHPVFLTSSPPGQVLLPSHTSEMGFFALRVQTQMRDVLAVLRDR